LVMSCQEWFDVQQFEPAIDIIKVLKQQDFLCAAHDWIVDCQIFHQCWA